MLDDQQVIALKHGLPQPCSNSLCHFLLLNGTPDHGCAPWLNTGEYASGCFGCEIVGMHQHSRNSHLHAVYTLGCTFNVVRALPNDRDKNGVFTRIFLREMQKPGITVDRIVRNVRSEVVNLAKSVGHDQVPAIYDQTIGEFYFRSR